MKPNTPNIIKKSPIIRYHERAKLNKVTPVLRCGNCFELSTFRVFQANGKNRVACVLCLNSVRYNKTKPLSEQGITLNKELTLNEVCKRYKFRLKTFFFGNHIYGPFGRRRTK
jgi:hypothetical protein